MALHGACIERCDENGLTINEVYFPYSSPDSSAAGSAMDECASDNSAADGDAAVPAYAVCVGASQQRDLEFPGSFTGRDLQISSESVGMEGNNMASPTRNGQPVVLSGISSDAEMKARQDASFPPLPAPFQVSSDDADVASECTPVVVASVMPAGRAVPPLPDAPCSELMAS